MNPICLITPPSPFLLDQRVFASLGILRVASSLEAAGYPVEHLDLSGIANYEEAVTDHMARTNAHIFGLTATTPQMPAAMKIRAAIRKVKPYARLILGGPHVTLVNAAMKREIRAMTPGRAHRAFSTLLEAFTVLVCGDGEDAVLEAVKSDAKQVIDADNIASTHFLTNARYNELPLPARHLIDLDSYHYAIEGERAHSLIAQLGCPYGCGFCGGRESAMLRRIRTRTTANVVSEIRHLYERYGVKGFMLYDDELNVNKEMIPLMDAITDLQSELGVTFRLRGFIKSNLFTDNQASAMYRAGFRWILVGFESGSPRILENINKKATREENTECMAIARRHGLKVKALMSIGHPGESEDTLFETWMWLREHKPDDFDVTIITTYPGTPYYDHAIETTPGIWTYTCPKSGDRLHAYEVDFNATADYYKGIQGEYKSYVFTDFLGTEELVMYRDDMEERIREELGIPYPTSAAAIAFDHTMGQHSILPPNILRKSETSYAK